MFSGDPSGFLGLCSFLGLLSPVFKSGCKYLEGMEGIDKLLLLMPALAARVGLAALMSEFEFCLGMAFSKLVTLVLYCPGPGDR